MQYDFAVAAGQSQTLDIAGRFFKYRSGTGSIRVRASKGGYVDLLPGQGVWNIEFTSLTITDKSGAANAGVIIAGDFDFHDDRITGSVEVIDGGRTRTLSGIAFLGGNNQGALAGQTSSVQLWNPAGSGKNIVVKEISLSGSSSGLHSIKCGNVRATNVSGNVPSKLIGGGASTAQSCVQNGDLTATSFISNVQIQANQTYTKAFFEPVVLRPGYGIHVTSFTLNEEIFANFEFVEETA